MPEHRSALRTMREAPRRVDDRVRNWKGVWADPVDPTIVEYRCMWQRADGRWYAFDISFDGLVARGLMAARLRQARNQHRKDSHE